MALFGALLRIVWNTKADKTDVDKRPTNDQVTAMIRIAVEAFATLDNQSDQAQIAPVATELKALKEQTLMLHNQNRDEMKELRTDVRQLLNRIEQ